MSEYRGRRITADEVEAAEKAPGFAGFDTDIYVVETDDGFCGCGLAALALAEGWRPGYEDDDPPSWVQIQRALKIPPDYDDGFSEAFGGYRDTWDSTSAGYLAGHEDGRAARARVFGEPVR